MLNNVLTIGSDPEVFITAPNGKIVAAHSVNIPHVNDSIKTERGKFFRDGWALEINPAPAHNAKELYNNIACVLDEAVNRLPNGYGVSTIPCTNIDLEDLANAPSDVQEFGCNPSYDAYKLRVSHPNVDAKTFPLRSLSGHLHFSGLKILDDPENYPKIIKFFDLHIGLPLSYFFSRFEQYERRKFYGRAGEFRIQRYPGDIKGVEYRTLDAQILNNVAYFDFAIRRARWVLSYFNKLNWDSSIDDDLQEAINEGNAKLQKKLLNINSIEIMNKRSDRFLFRML